MNFSSLRLQCGWRSFVGFGLIAFGAAAVVGAVEPPAPSSGTSETDEPPRPNIVVILADDMGYSDLGCYGGEIRTPNIDGLAEGGLRFRRFYNNARCCPTRASLLTGLYSHRAGFGRMTFSENQPGYQGRLRPETATLAELLRDAGYRTLMAGKWHLSPTRFERGMNQAWVSHRIDLGPFFSDPESYPINSGFDEHYGTIWGIVNYYDPFSLVRGEERIEEVPEDFYYTDAINDEAARMIDRAVEADDGRPFFLYIAHCAPHWPLHAPEEDIEQYVSTYEDGWDTIRAARYERLVDLGLVDPDRAPLSPRVNPDRRWEDEPDRDWQARAMATHAAMIDRMDQGIGRVLKRLSDHELMDDTLIVVLSDNGASPEQPLGPGFDRPSMVRDGRPVVYHSTETMPGPELTFFGIGPMWANVSNTPFRSWKADTHEGGIRTPMIAHWPNGLATPPGTITDQIGHVIDFVPTCLELAGASYPETFDERKLAPLAGRSLAPILEGRRRDGHPALFWEHYGKKGALKDGWKAVRPKLGRWELYNLEEDETELTNLAAERPEIVRDLERQYNAWAEANFVVPAPR